MTYFTLICNGLLLIVIPLSMGEEFQEKNLVLTLPFLINIFVLWKRTRPDGRKKGLITYLSLIFSVFLFIGTVVEWTDHYKVSWDEVMIFSSLLLTSLMTIIVLTGLGEILSLYFKRKRLEGELKVRELEKRLNEDKKNDLQVDSLNAD